MNTRSLILGGWLLAALCVATSAATSWPEAKITVHAADDNGKPVQDAKVGINVEPISGKMEHKKGLTDANGTFELTTNTTFRIFAAVTKSGYYTSRAVYEYPIGQLYGLKVMPEKWEPYNAVINMLFRKIINPIPMYAKKVEMVIPRADEEFGFDLMAGDWVAPLGKGVTKDFIFKVSGVYNSYNDNDSTMTLTFSNPGDGLMPFPLKLSRTGEGSELRLPQTAPEGDYTAPREWRKARSLKQPGSMDVNAVNEINENQNYYFRVRTVLDKKGDVQSAFYGKIYGDFDFGGASKQGSYIKFDYYLNPTANDRNVEFDVKRNLFTGLKGTDAIKNP